ncbi:alpha/beta hydrolase [Paenarthrobacter sp. PH39-S1]|uniref:alpha/beta fold hydrolase n=1 Tax=Paenarthrobacter sp. PH39-S1 TaxID=3046204 RepID=UPI0024BA9193|nr:alpha/beta hydrolase [Paenarthrobacter sp. PH39-S1]MDJ0356657.1 alpha/beta hydrolase [Paenarthrobacter sp. PH39-S1]
MTQTVHSADGTPIAYEQSGAGPALILTLGALTARKAADGLVSLLDQVFTVYSYDRRGRGDSGDAAAYSVEREVDDLHALLAAAGGTAYLYGHSSGGILALRAAASTSGFSKVAVYEPPFCTEFQPGFPEHIADLLTEGRRDDAVADWMRNTGAPFEEGWKHAFFWPEMVALANSLPYDLAVTGDGSLPVDDFQRVTANVLALYGGDSEAWAAESARAVARAIPGARSEVVPGQNHPVAHDVIAPIIIHFFK